MKGRNPRLIKKRNEFLIKRYYYWYEVERMRRDDVLEKLSEEEVFLDIEYISFILRQNSQLLKQIKRRQPTPKQLDDFAFEEEALVVGAVFL